jgi:hypothetical protein
MSTVQGNWFKVNVERGNMKVKGEFDLLFVNNKLIISLDFETLNYGVIEKSIHIPFSSILYDEKNSVLHAQYKPTEFTMFFRYQMMRFSIREDRRQEDDTVYYRYKIHIHFTGPIYVHELWRQIIMEDSSWTMIPEYNESEPEPIEDVVYELLSEWTSTPWEIRKNK